MRVHLRAQRALEPPRSTVFVESNPHLQENSDSTVVRDSGDVRVTFTLSIEGVSFIHAASSLSL